jgi:hypothetical protein
MRDEDFFCNLDVLFGGLGICKLQFLNNFFSSCFSNFRSSKPWIWIRIRILIWIRIPIDKKCGPTTLVLLIFYYLQEEEEDLPEEPIVPVIRQQDNKARTSKERRISEDVERSRRIAAEVGTYLCTSSPPHTQGVARIRNQLDSGPFFRIRIRNFFPDLDTKQDSDLF